MKTSVLSAFLGGLAAVVILVLWRGFFVQHATIVGIAVAMLIFSIFRTRQRLRRIYRK